MTVAYMSADAVYDWPDWSSRVENTHGFGTAGLPRTPPGRPAQQAEHAATGVDSLREQPYAQE